MDKDTRREELSAEIHKCYCRAYERRYGHRYWTLGDYSKLDEDTKNYDREMADYLIERERSLEERVKEQSTEIDKLKRGLTASQKFCIVEAIHEKDDQIAKLESTIAEMDKLIRQAYPVMLEEVKTCANNAHTTKIHKWLDSALRISRGEK